MQKRATIYLDPEIHKALRLKAAETDLTVSKLVNEAVRLSLGEDAHDMAVIKVRAREPRRPFEEFVRDLRRRGKL